MGLNVPPGLTPKPLSYADRVAFNHVLLLGFSQPPFYTLRHLFPKMLTPAVSPPSHFTTLHRFYLAPSLRKSKAVPFLPLYAFVAWTGISLSVSPSVVISVSTPYTSVIFSDLYAVVCSHVCGTLRSCCVVHIVVVL